MRLRLFLGTGLLGLCVVFAGCDDSGDREAELAEAARELEEAKRLLEQAKADLEQANTGEVNEPEIPAYILPPDHLEPFEKSFGFGNPDEVAHFWKWVQQWEFTDANAVSKQKPGGAVLASKYMLTGDFKITVKGKLSQSWTNSKRSQFEVCGQAIGLANWKPTAIDLTIERIGNLLTYQVRSNPAVVVELTYEQAGPTQPKLIAYGRYATIREFSIAADSADRIPEE